MDEGGLLGGKFLFKKLPDGLLDKTRVRCTICNAEFKYHRSSSSLAYHLRAKHPTESTSTGPRQSTLQEYGACGRITKNVREKVTNSLVVWIAKNCRPVSIVEDDGLREVIRAASGDECYNLPSRGTIVSRLHTLYGDQRAQQSSKLVQMQIYMYNSDDFESLTAALREKRIIAAMAVFFQVGGRDNPAVDPIIHGLKGVVHHEKETFLEPFVLKDLLPSSLGSYYRYTGSLTTPPCSKVVEWIIFSSPVYFSYKQLEAFYSIFTTEQQDHVKSVEYLRSNFRPIQSLDNRHVFKSAVKDAWLPDLNDSGSNPYGTEASKVCSSAPINMKVQHVNGSALVVRWAHPEVTYHSPIQHFLVSYSWTAHDDSYEETHLTDAKHKLEAIISPVSPDVLYLFRVQAVCTNDMRSDFSQSMLFRANTTRIFEGTRIVKTGMPTLSPASSADMAPISSGSSTWTSSGIPFSFVSMATGIGPSSSGSQATVASVVTSTLLAGLGFSGGVISSFPSYIWPSRAPNHNPTSHHQATKASEQMKDTPAVVSAAVKDNNEAGSEDRENCKGQGEDREREGEATDDEKEEEEKKDKERKGSGGLSRAKRKDSNIAAKHLFGKMPYCGAREKEQTEKEPTKPPPVRKDQLKANTYNPLHSYPSLTAESANQTAAVPIQEDLSVTLRHRIMRDEKHRPFSYHTGPVPVPIQDST
ncbi:receptor-type tyrosine-protein phosphatase gamma isoform X3 [Maylandia zebra]|uniref:receptor-type tyrosine-protein phosphatase gamma isoform X3 n=1 Tax=Maylandia zebra TaxID=106582 RepID=UPI00403C9815